MQELEVGDIVKRSRQYCIDNYVGSQLTMRLTAKGTIVRIESMRYLIDWDNEGETTPHKIYMRLYAKGNS